MLNARELPLNILPNDCDINIVVSVVDRREWVAKVDIWEQIQVLIEFMIVVVLGVNSFLRNHYSQKDAFVLLQELSFLHVFEGEVFDYVEMDGDVSCFEYL